MKTSEYLQVLQTLPMQQIAQLGFNRMTANRDRLGAHNVALNSKNCTREPAQHITLKVFLNMRRNERNQTGTGIQNPVDNTS